MRIDLKVPFAQKDAVKVLGARWDAAKKVWYIKDVADLSPFLHWIPNLDAAPNGSTGGTTRQSTDRRHDSIKQSDGVTTGPVVVVPHCGCNVLPWEDCEHTANR